MLKKHRKVFIVHITSILMDQISNLEENMFVTSVMATSRDEIEDAAYLTSRQIHVVGGSCYDCKPGPITCKGCKPGPPPGCRPPCKQGKTFYEVAEH